MQWTNRASIRSQTVASCLDHKLNFDISVDFVLTLCGQRVYIFVQVAASQRAIVYKLRYNCSKDISCAVIAWSGFFSSGINCIDAFLKEQHVNMDSLVLCILFRNFSINQTIYY